MNERRKCVPLREHNMGGGTMDRDTLLLRISLIWLAVLTAGCVYVLLALKGRLSWRPRAQRRHGRDASGRAGRAYGTLWRLARLASA
jgi:hypothetical protein